MSKFQMDVISHVLYVTFLLDTVEVDYINGFVKTMNFALVWGLMHNDINSKFIKIYKARCIVKWLIFDKFYTPYKSIQDFF